MDADQPRVRGHRATEAGTVGELAPIRAVSAAIRGEVVVVRALGRQVFPPPLAGGRISECGLAEALQQVNGPQPGEAGGTRTDEALGGA